MSAKSILKALFLSAYLLILSGCNEYWWTRGQPPSTVELLNRALSRVEEAREEFSDRRPEIAKAAEAISSAVSSVPASYEDQSVLASALSKLESELLSLEGKLSYGNRPPYNELFGQLRALQKLKEQELTPDSLNMYFARLLFFLSTEMKVPAPNKISKT